MSEENFRYYKLDSNIVVEIYYKTEFEKEYKMDDKCKKELYFLTGIVTTYRNFKFYTSNGKIVNSLSFDDIAKIKEFADSQIPEINKKEEILYENFLNQLRRQYGYKEIE